MDELLLNGLGRNVDSLPKEIPLQTEKFVPKFKGKQPIVKNGKNFLNRKKPIRVGTDIAEITKTDEQMYQSQI